MAFALDDELACDKSAKQRHGAAIRESAKRDGAKLAERPDLQTVMAQLPIWFDD